MHPNKSMKVTIADFDAMLVQSYLTPRSAAKAPIN